MNLLLLMYALLSALTGANGAARVVAAPPVATRMADSTLVAAQAKAMTASRPAVTPPRAPLGMMKEALSLPVAVPIYLDRLRE